MQVEGVSAGILVQIAFFIIVAALLLVIWFKGNDTPNGFVDGLTGDHTGKMKTSVVSKKTMPKGFSNTNILESISELSDYLEEIPFSAVEEWSEKIAKEELDSTLNRIHSLAKQIRETPGDIDTPDELDITLDTVRERFQQARKEIETRGSSESQYYRLVVNLNRAVLEAKANDASDPEQIESVRDALHKVKSFKTKPYFSTQLTRRAERARVEAQDLLPSRI